MKKIFFLSISIAFSITAFIGILFVLQHILINNSAEEPDDRIGIASEMRPVIPEAAPKFKMHESVSTETLEIQPVAEKIDSNTRIIYEYFYEEDQTTETIENATNFYQLELTEKELAEIHEGWEIVSFSNKEVVLRKTVHKPNAASYVLGVSDGYVAVFYEDAVTIKEITNRPVITLPQEEQEKLIEGIFIESDGELVKRLEDYTS